MRIYFANEDPRKNGLDFRVMRRGPLASLPPLLLFLASGANGCNCPFSRRPWISPLPRVHLDAPSLSPWELTIKSAHGDGFAARFERAFRIRSGFIGHPQMISELFLPNWPTILGIAGCPSVLAPLWRRNYLKCGISRLAAASLPIDGPWKLRARAARNSLRRFREMSKGR